MGGVTHDRAATSPDLRPSSASSAARTPKPAALTPVPSAVYHQYVLINRAARPASRDIGSLGNGVSSHWSPHRTPCSRAVSGRSASDVPATPCGTGFAGTEFADTGSVIFVALPQGILESNHSIV